jgi:hypothetical protein
MRPKAEELARTEGPPVEKAGGHAQIVHLSSLKAEFRREGAGVKQGAVFREDWSVFGNWRLREWSRLCPRGISQGAA